MAETIEDLRARIEADLAPLQRNLQRALWMLEGTARDAARAFERAPIIPSNTLAAHARAASARDRDPRDFAALRIGALPAEEARASYDLLERFANYGRWIRQRRGEAAGAGTAG